jgi:hypothetical protein
MFRHLSITGLGQSVGKLLANTFYPRGKFEGSQFELFVGANRLNNFFRIVILSLCILGALYARHGYCVRCLDIATLNRSDIHESFLPASITSYLSSAF